jgi:hypothetical protein
LDVGTRRSLLGGLAATVAMAGLALTSAPAMATPPDPGTTNIPSLGWRGENLRLVTCDNALNGASSVGFAVEDWSGDPLRLPTLVPGTVALFNGSGQHAGQRCASGTFLTQGAGMALIKLAAQNSTGGGVLAHQFFAGWMNIEKPSISGGGDFNAGGPGREVIATVKGDMPMNGFGGINGNLVLPDQWATLAQQLAGDANASDATPWMRWDIHDDQSAAEGHSTVVGCLPLSANGTDAVDNCAGGNTAFSTVFGFSAGPTIGPFDPLRANETLLANGILDAGDAPMPAARIDFTIAPNSGRPNDTSGVGSWANASKPADYSRDGTGAPTPHNLYAPFSSAYIPATSAPAAEASGVAGPQHGADFPGFLVNGRYDYWTKAYSLASATGAATDCTLGGLPNGRTVRHQPLGDQSVVAYTDEHGEARMTYVPGTGAYYDSLGLDNANQGCDLNGVDVLGTSSITATARYPYQPQVRSPLDQASDTVVARVHSLFSKTLAAYAKGTGSDNAVARIVVAHAQDVDGSPFANETVCGMNSNRSSGLRPFYGVTGTAAAPIDLAGSTPAADPFPGLGRVCIHTNSQGNAAWETFNGTGGTVDLIAEFVDEGLLRHIDVSFGPAADTGQTSNPVTNTTITEIHNSTTTPGGTPGGPTTGPKGSVPPVTIPPHKTFKLAMARLVRPVGKAPYLLVRVNGPAGKKAGVHAKLYSAGHMAKGSFVRSVAVNKTVKLTSPKLTKKIRSVRVTI